jgi:hypothetical protein
MCWTHLPTLVPESTAVADTSTVAGIVIEKAIRSAYKKVRDYFYKKLLDKYISDDSLRVLARIIQVGANEEPPFDV